MGGVVNAVSTVVSFTILGWLTKGKKPKDTVQRIGELSEQTAKEGEPRPIVWGRVRPIRGNIMHVSTPRIVLQEVKGQRSGGKGGKKKQPKQYQERVFRAYAIRICEGPITAVIRVWRNNKLVYDARGNDWGATNNGVFLKLARFYLGGWDQMPDPALESIWGAGEVPGYRGTCYMVVGDEDLTDMGGTVPQYTFEVERAEGTYLTSRPYAVEDVESFQGESYSQGGSFRSGTIDSNQGVEAIEAGGASLVSGSFRAPLVLTDQGFESLDSGGSSLVSGDFRSTLVSTDQGVEAFDSAGANLVSGVFRVGLISYNPNEFEALDSGGASLVGGNHANP